MHVNAHLDVDVLALEQDDTVTVLLEMQAPAASAPQGERPAHTVVVVLDRSGSMHGGRIEAAKAAIVSLIERLDPRDKLAVVAFDDEAEVVLPARSLADHGKDHAAMKVRGIQSGGQTDLSAGYLRGIQEAKRAAGPAGATLILLSDGHANSGIVDDAALGKLAADSHSKGITTSTIGVGLGYDESILVSMARGGAGNHAFAERDEETATALAAEVEGLLTKTAQAATLLVKPGSPVVSVSILNDLPSTLADEGILVELGDFYADETRRVCIQLGVPAVASLGLLQVATIEARCVEVPALVEHSLTLPVTVNVLPGDQAAGRVRDAKVEHEKLLLSVQAAKLASEEALRRGDVHSAKDALSVGMASLSMSPIMDDRTREESDWFARSMDLLDERDSAYNAKRMSASRSSKARGMWDRKAGGEMGDIRDDDASS